MSSKKENSFSPDLLNLLELIFNTNKFEILTLLNQGNGDLSYTELSKSLKHSKGNLSHHLRVLEAKGLITSRLEIIESKAVKFFTITKDFGEAVKNLKKHLIDGDL
jgi:predicted transcriptional regulator